MDKHVPELRFPNFKNNWKPKKLGNIINSLDAGVSVNSTDKKAIDSKELGILKTSCVTNGFFDPTENKLVDEELEITRLKEPAQKNSIIISRMNTPALVGANALITKDYPNLFLPDRLWAGKINSDNNPSWLANVLSSYKMRAELSARATGTSGSMKNITKGDVLTIPIVAPKLPEQQKIADFLSSVDNKIRLLTEKQTLLQHYKKGVMQKLFPSTGSGQVPELRFASTSSAQVTSTSEAKSKVAEPVEAYPDWEEKKFYDLLEDVLDFRGRTPKKIGMEWGDGEIISLSANNVKNGYIDFDSECNLASDLLYEKWMGKVNLNKNDIVFTMEAPLGKALLIPDSRKYILSQRVVAFKTNKDVDNNFLIQLIWSKPFQNTIERLSTGSTAKGINQRSFKKVKIKIPCLKEQQKIASFLSEIDKKMEAVTKQIEHTQTFKKGLLQKMFV